VVADVLTWPASALLDRDEADADAPSTPAARPAALELLPAADRAYVLDGFRRLLPAPVDLEPGLRAVVRDLLDHPGSLARAQLVFGVLRDLGGAPEAARALAVAVEYFHTASLVFDDLPSMDDASERRGRPCPHRAHGEASAVLGALALINRAYGLLWGVLAGLPAERSRRAAALVEECLGAAGVLDGQARDLRFDPRRAGAREVLRVAAGKTVPLVRLSLVLPALAGGAGDEELALLEEVSEAWGFAYQVLDDFKDLLSSREETGKSPARDRALGRPNLPAAVGFWDAMDRLVAFLARGCAAITALERRDPRWARLGRLQRFLEDERRRLVLRVADEGH
jgi:geranylgeranyl pyrophosphate synthase